MDERKKGGETRGSTKSGLRETTQNAGQMSLHGYRDPEKHEEKQVFSAFCDVD
jgi:hypothetical protein